MKRNMVIFFICTIFLVTLIGCSKDASKEPDLNQLIRVDVQVYTGDNGDNEIIIAEEEDIKTLREVFARMKWEQNVKAEMDRQEDMKATLFFRYDKNMPERLFDYYIWINKGDGSVTIIDRGKNALGKLVKEDAEILTSILLKS